MSTGDGLSADQLRARINALEIPGDVQLNESELAYFHDVPGQDVEVFTAIPGGGIHGDQGLSTAASGLDSELFTGIGEIPGGGIHDDQGLSTAASGPANNLGVHGEGQEGFTSLPSLPSLPSLSLSEHDGQEPSTPSSQLPERPRLPKGHDLQPTPGAGRTGTQAPETPAGSCEDGAVNTVMCGGLEAARTVSKFLGEMFETEWAVAAVKDMMAAEVGDGVAGPSVPVIEQVNARIRMNKYSNPEDKAADMAVLAAHKGNRPAQQALERCASTKQEDPSKLKGYLTAKLTTELTGGRRTFNVSMPFFPHGNRFYKQCPLRCQGPKQGRGCSGAFVVPLDLALAISGNSFRMPDAINSCRKNPQSAKWEGKKEDICVEAEWRTWACEILCLQTRAAEEPGFVDSPGEWEINLAELMDKCPKTKSCTDFEDAQQGYQKAAENAYTARKRKAEQAPQDGQTVLPPRLRSPEHWIPMFETLTVDQLRRDDRFQHLFVGAYLQIKSELKKKGGYSPYKDKTRAWFENGYRYELDEVGHQFLAVYDENGPLGLLVWKFLGGSGIYISTVVIMDDAQREGLCTLLGACLLSMYPGKTLCWLVRRGNTISTDLGKKRGAARWDRQEWPEEEFSCMEDYEGWMFSY